MAVSGLASRITGILFFRSLTHRLFAALWWGQTLSRVGDFLYEIALAWWVLEKTGSPAAVAGVLIFGFTPTLIFLLLGGAAVDRFNRAALMLASDLLRGLIVSVVAALAFTDLLRIWHLYIASLIFGLVDAFFQPAYTALVPDLVPADDLTSANSLTSMSQQIGRVAGPAIGAATVSLGGTSLAFALNAGTFFASAIFMLPLLRLGMPKAEAATGEKSNLLADVREGIAMVLGTPWLIIGIALFSLVNVTLVGPYSVAMPFLVKDYLHGDVGTLGLLYAAFPVGYVMAGIWLGRMKKIRHRGLLAYIGVVLAGLMLLLFGLPVPFLLLVVAALINGAGLEVSSLIWSITLQEIVPREQLGRVASIDMLGSFVLLPVGLGIVGWATPLLGPAPIFVIGGSVTAVLAGIALLHPGVHNLD